MNASSTAIILVGYQNDYFDRDGILRGVLEDAGGVDEVLADTIRLVEAVKDSPVTLITTPIIFSPTYAEISQSDGILRAIKEAGAFQAGTDGSKTIPQIASYGDRIIEVPGKRGLNAFTETPLDQTLLDRGIENVVMAGAVTSICIDSTGRAAYERGMQVAVLEDCTAARTRVEQEFFCSVVFPTYATVMNVDSLIGELGLPVD